MVVIVTIMAMVVMVMPVLMTAVIVAVVMIVMIVAGVVIGAALRPERARDVGDAAALAAHHLGQHMIVGWMWMASAVTSAGVWRLPMCQATRSRRIGCWACTSSSRSGAALTRRGARRRASARRRRRSTVACSRSSRSSRPPSAFSATRRVCRPSWSRVEPIDDAVLFDRSLADDAGGAVHSLIFRTGNSAAPWAAPSRARRRAIRRRRDLIGLGIDLDVRRGVVVDHGRLGDAAARVLDGHELLLDAEAARARRARPPPCDTKRHARCAVRALPKAPNIGR